MATSGTRANKRGTTLEKSIEALLSEDYQKVAAKDFFDSKKLKKPIFAAQCTMGKDIYGKDRRVDFILYHPNLWKNCLVIQCKWQSSSGSVEQKYPFEVLSIKASGFETIIVLDGGGYSAGAENWLKAQAGKNKLLNVFNLGEIYRFQSQGRI